VVAVAHGVGGWELVDYTWSEKTGIGTYTYEREVLGTGTIQTAVIEKAQPMAPHHQGWFTQAAGFLRF